MYKNFIRSVDMFENEVDEEEGTADKFVRLLLSNHNVTQIRDYMYNQVALL